MVILHSSCSMIQRKTQGKNRVRGLRTDAIIKLPFESQSIIQLVDIRVNKVNN